MGGSSPLTRGKPASDPLITAFSGLIPAHAGKTHRRRRRPLGVWAHPRSRGENEAPPPPSVSPRGSSPLTRGKLHGIRDPLASPGLIPAHAGKTSGPRSRPVALRAHPRSRGENVDDLSDGLGFGGSSPLTRGKHIDTCVDFIRSGLIPAHAGKTTDAREPAPLRWAHPRSRGENHRMKSVAASVTGSSPLTRGKLAALGSIGSTLGLIPAHAGKTMASISAAV